MGSEIRKAYKGWLTRKIIARKYGIDERTMLLILPENDVVLNYFFLLYMDEFRTRMGLDSIVILSTAPEIRTVASVFSACIRQVVVVRTDTMNALLTYANMVPFPERFVLGTFDKLRARTIVTRLCGEKGVLLEELIAVGIYRLLPYRAHGIPKREKCEGALRTYLYSVGDRHGERTL